MFKNTVKIFLLCTLLGGIVSTVGAAPPEPHELDKLEPQGPSQTPCPYPDPYEDDGGGDRDDWFATASTLTTAGQPGHTFDRYADKDWAQFEARAGYLYTIKTGNLTPPYDPAGFFADTDLELYAPDGVTLIERSDDYGGTYASRIDWYARESGTYYVKVHNYNGGVYGCDVGYDLTLSEQGALQLLKTAEDLNGEPLLEGDVIHYTVTVTNTSTTIQFTTVVITDPIPSGTTFVPNSAVLSKGLVLKTTPLLEASVGTMDPGEVVTLQFDVQVDSGTESQDIVNQAYVRCDQMGVIGSPPATPASGGRVEPGLAINKTALDVNGPPVLPGDRISYTIVVTNQSTIRHTNVVITDIIPTGATYVDGSANVPPGSLVLPVGQTLVATWGSLAPSDEIHIEFAVTVDEGEELGPNVAVVSSDQQNPNATDPVYPPTEKALLLTKGAKDLNGGPLYAGDEILYTVVVANLLAGPQTNVVITDAVPANTTYVASSASVSQGSLSGPDPLVADVGTLQAGEKAVLTFRVTVDAGSASQVIGNEAQAGSDQQVPPVSVGPIEPEPGGGTVQDGQQALGISKTAEDWNGGPLYPGDEIWYTISVVNLLTTTQQNVMITDAIPDYTTYVADSAAVSPGMVTGTDPVMASVGTLEPGQRAVLTFRVTVDAGAVGKVIENTAQATSDVQGPPVVTPPVQPYPDPLPGYPDSGGGWVLDGDQQIGIRKSAVDINGAPLNPNDTISYTVVIWNEVTIPQTNVVITDHVPDFTTYVAGSLTWTKGTLSGPDPLLVNVGTLDVGERITVTFQVRVDGAATAQTIANRAWVGSDQQIPQAHTPPVTTPDGGTVVTPAGPTIYLPLVARNV
jgi:uncharacterized repeat protein (TIGR01451 family)